MVFLYRLHALLAVLLLSTSAVQATETRILTLGGDPVLLPDDELDIFLFPHRLAQRPEKFLDADLTREYVVYAGSKYIFALGREETSIAALSPNASRRRPALDMGWVSGNMGWLGTLAWENPTGNKGAIDITLKGSQRRGQRDVAMEVEVLSVEKGDTGLGIRAYGRQDIDWMDGAFNLGIASLAFENLGEKNGFNRTLEGKLGVGRNTQIDPRTRMVYGVVGQLQQVAGGEWSLFIPTIFGGEFELYKGVVMRLSGVKAWGVLSTDQNGTQISSEPTVFSYGLGVRRGRLTVDVQFESDILRENPLGGDSDFTRTTSMTLWFD
ncbi:MAG: hypothetical protein GKR89_34105 [Candidatus Latescibacteria bacterium]|nr:hypothetical protein [Candidatus Latescibacterota bacterium]